MAKEKTKKSSIWAEFKAFISRGNIVEMAVGVAVATAFTAIVTAFTKGFISPLIGLITGGTDLTAFKLVVKEAVISAEGVVTQEEVAFLWGAFIQAIIDFLIIAVAMFLILKAFAAASAKTRELKEKAHEEEIAAAKAEEEAKAAEEAKVAEEAKAAEEAKIAAEEARKEEEIALLREIAASVKK